MESSTNNKSRCAFLTTIYPMPQKHLIEFFDSLENQTYSKFDVVVVNDGFEDFVSIKTRYKLLNIIELKCSDTPAKNREYGINYAKNNGYEKLLFGDSDDSFSKNRVKISLDLLNKYDIVVNDLSLFSNEGLYDVKYISNRLSSGSEVSLGFVRDKNIFGFTNTAINLNKIPRVTFDPNIVAVDWYFFTDLLLRGAKAAFTNECVSYYRQHENSVIGLQGLTKKALKKGIQVKLNHYKKFTEFIDLYEKMNHLSMMDNELVYLKLKTCKINYPLWWEEIKGGEY
ncbi:MAG: glycosyltransferase [Helicobacteraceae bacterium]|nr:glycosyltransferase [Helicobacteraceae bacterium]